jgi:LuxR family maltose regulon positive regulatory protein
LLARLAAAGHHDTATTDASGLAVCGMVGDVFRLSRKERQVARHLIRGATSQEIAERLFVSLSTIKTHTKNIYAKLGVNKRLQAVELLMKLDLA